MEKLKKYEYWGFFVILGISALYMIFSLYINVDNIFLDWFTPISNSLWEFGKLMFSSILLYSIVEYFVFGREYPNFFFAKAATLFLAPIIFIFGSYLLDIIIGIVYPTTHILMFIIAVGLGQYFSYVIMEREFYFRYMNSYAIITTIIMIGILLSILYDTTSFRSPIFEPMETYQQNRLFRR